MECLGLYNKPKADVHPGHKLTGSKEEEELQRVNFWIVPLLHSVNDMSEFASPLAVKSRNIRSMLLL